MNILFPKHMEHEYSYTPMFEMAFEGIDDEVIKTPF